jgi:hypothetical protein
VRQLDRNDLSFHVHPRIARIAARAGFLDMTSAAATVLLAERLTAGVLVLDHGPILIDAAAECAVARVRTRFPRSNPDADAFAIVSWWDPFFDVRQVGFVRGLLCGQRCKSQKNERETFHTEHSGLQATFRDRCSVEVSNVRNSILFTVAAYSTSSA